MAFTPRTMSPRALRAVFMSSFVPRECGIATFTEDLITAVSAHGITSKVIAMNRPKETHAYDARVITTVRENQAADYQAAAALINQGRFDVLSIQHEFGIFGGETSELLAEFLEAVRIPIISTFHTVLRYPSPTMRRNLRAVAAQSSAIVVMNGLAINLLEDIYGIDPRKIVMIHHGAPVTPRERQLTMKKNLNLQGHKVVSTFGLLSSAKGIEYAIQAMPYIVDKCPEAIYLVLGQTHPIVKQEEGERYRESLKALAEGLNVQNHVRFVDKYFTKAELIAYLLATDVYLTPYLNMEQVTSGTLAYALACGRPLVSTPYLYAQFLLGEDRGLLVPPTDPAGIADACLQILAHPELKARMERANWRYGQTMMWPHVGRQYLELFQQTARVQAPVFTFAQAV